MEFKKRDLLIEDTSEEGVIKKVLSKLKDFKNRASSEIKETKALVKILTHAIKSYAKNREFDLNNEEKKFIKGQSGDVVRGLVLSIVAIIPLPIPLTPFLIIFGKKLGIDLTPTEHEIPKKGQTKKEKIDEARKMNILLTEEQYLMLSEMSKKYKNILQKLCYNQKENKPFCSLYKLNNELDEDTQVELEVAMEVLDSYFRFKNVGLFPRIVELALQDKGRTVSYLKLLSDFIQDDSFDNTQTKKILDKQRKSKVAPENLNDLIKQARTLELLSNHAAGIGDHSTGDFYKNAEEALQMLVDADDKLEAIGKYFV